MSTLTKTADVAIIGGGILGVSAAFFLSRHKSLHVAVFEKDLLAQGSTGLSVGGFRQQFSHPANVRLSQSTLRFFSDFQQQYGVDLQLKQVGYLFLAQKENTWTDFQTGVRTQTSLGVSVELLSTREISRRWPYLKCDDLLGGTFGPEDGYADPYLVTMSIARAAREAGVAVYERTKVTGISVENNKVAGLQTNRGSVSTGVVINAAGPWAGEICRMVGRNDPVFPFRRQVFATRPFDGIPKPVPMILDFDSLFYMRGDGPGLLLGKSDPAEPPGYNTHVDRSFMERVVKEACHRAPPLEAAEIANGWGGLYTITPDENAIIGPVPGIEGFYTAIGFSGHGFQHGPAVGRILSELIVDGQTLFDLTPYFPDRFSGATLHGEKRTV